MSMMELRAEPGTVIAASPDLGDPNFMHAVVLICAHGDQGAHGLVINRPAPLTVDKLLPEHPRLASTRFPIHAGGPVGLDTLQFVHRVPDTIPGGYELGGGVYLGGDLEAVGLHISRTGDSALRDLRMILGYSGWSAGQLEIELAGGSWLPSALDPDWLFEAEPQLVWRKVMRALGEHGAGLLDLPPDVTWN
ncbi:MAG: YqgE/AlgH family protein [Planctomycetota bacterium]